MQSTQTATRLEKDHAERCFEEGPVGDLEFLVRLPMCERALFVSVHVLALTVVAPNACRLPSTRESKTPYAWRRRRKRTVPYRTIFVTAAGVGR